ncbi:hypothetical protein [Sphingobacterium sp. FBM7-1]|uniref:hypothetical protein n=1 Tax=Sphingobacterium sp. FBM7-1 TaxID=2886688 RepID=UPI001D12F461|nr:hypothetical protein [Sphingobacterium sp. FBM7-1]MCC2598565.1 hypothetical protein [Sphingobacterium sp. FBM7-1]
MAELFGRNRVTITQHIGNIFKEGELDEIVVCKDFLHTTRHGAIQGKTQDKANRIAVVLNISKSKNRPKEAHKNKHLSIMKANFHPNATL